MLKSLMNKHNLLFFESFSRVEKRYLLKSSVLPLGCLYMTAHRIFLYGSGLISIHRDSNSFVVEQRSSQI